MAQALIPCVDVHAASLAGQGLRYVLLQGFQDSCIMHVLNDSFAFLLTCNMQAALIEH